jgi:hypothetical protein
MNHGIIAVNRLQRMSSGVSAPSSQVTNLIVTAITDTSITFGFTRGNGAGVLVLVKQGSAVDSLPVDNTLYSANSAFGSGSQIGTGNYVVYIGTGNSVIVTGLTANTEYHFRAFEFNGSGASAKYITSTSTGNPSSEFSFTTQYQEIQTQAAGTPGTYTRPSLSKQRKENAFYRALITAGLHTKALSGKMFKTDGNAAYSTLDWVAPTNAAKQAELVSSPTFTSDVGWNSNGSSSYLLSGQDMADLTQNSVTYCFKGHTNVGVNVASFGAGDGASIGIGNRLQLRPRSSTDTSIHTVSDTTNTASPADVTDSRVRYAIARSAGNKHKSVNGGAFDTVAVALAAVTTPKEIFILSFNANGTANGFYTGGAVYFWVFNGKLTDVEIAAFDAAIVNYIS